MGLYNVVQPCFVGGRHHVRPTAQPIEVDDTEAAELVEAGSLTPYQPGLETMPIIDAPLSDPLKSSLAVAATLAPVAEDDEATEPSPPPRGRRRSTED